MRVDVRINPVMPLFCRGLARNCLVFLASTLSAQQGTPLAAPPAPIANFIDVAEKAGLTAQNRESLAT